MNKQTIKCPRCGKEHQFNRKTVSQDFECNHCHKKMSISRKSRIGLYVVNYFFALVVCLLISLVLVVLSFKPNFITNLVIVVISVLIIISQEKFGLWVLYKTFGIKYDEALENKK